MASIERRIVSVLFVDLVGFTSLSERLDPEDVAAIQDEYLQRASDAVGRHGGSIQKFIGDAISATFGIPTVQDDDALRAVRSGWAILSAIQGVGASLGLEPGELQVRAGVNTGRVVVAEHPADPAGWRITGDAVNVAARFQTAADPGCMVIGAETALRVGSEFDLEEIEPLELKGKSEPMPAWRVRGRRIGQRPTALSASFVGRADELMALRKGIEDPGRRVHLVVGPPGLGKTRLLDELAAQLASEGIECWRADPPTDAAIYQPIASLLQQALPELDAGTALRELASRAVAAGFDTSQADVIADHAAAIGWGDRLPADDPELVHRSLLISLGLMAPPGVVWLFEDLHDASHDLLSLLSKEAEFQTSGRAIVGSARPGFLDVVPFFENRTEILHLAPLSDRRVGELLVAHAGAAVATPAVVEAVVARAGGNPLFVEETVRSWVLSGRMVEVDGTMVAPDPRSLRPPSSIEAIYLGQLDDLPAPARRTARAVSVAGLSCPETALTELGGDPESVALLVRWGLLEADPSEDEPWVRYRHALLRDAAYGSLTRTERGHLHRVYADWLAARPEGDQRESIALHLEAAHQQTPPLARTEAMASAAADALEEAAAALLGAAPQRAAELFRRAIALTPAAGWEAGIRRRLGVAEAERRAGDLESAMDSFSEAGRQAARSHRGEEVARAAIGHEDALFASRLPRISHGLSNRRLLTSALELLPDRPNAARARTMAAQARAAIYQDGRRQGVAMATEALAVAEAAGDAGSQAYALLSLRLAHDRPDQLDNRRTFTESLIAAAHAAGDVERELEGARHLVIDHLQAGDTAASQASARRSEQLISALRQPLFFWYPAMWRSMYALMEGEHQAALRLVEEFRLEGERWGYRDTQLVYAAQLAHLGVQLGDPELGAAAGATAEGRVGYRWWAIAALLAQWAGDLGSARGYFDRMVDDDWSVIPDDLSASYVLALVTDLATFLGETDIADQLARQLAEWSGQAVVLGSGAVCLGAVDSFLGRAALAAGHDQRAGELLDRATALNRRLGARPALARTLRDLAQLRRDDADRLVAEAKALEDWCQAH